MLKFIAKQFRKPRGIVGAVVSKKMEENNIPLYDRLAHHLNLSGPRLALEIGYGPGTGMKRLLEKHRELTIEGIDFSRQMHKKASRINKNYIDGGRAALHCGDIRHFCPGMGLYDTVFGINVLYFWNPLKPFLEKIAGLLKPGGDLILYATDNAKLESIRFTRNEVFNKYDPEQITRNLSECGYEGIEREPLLSDEKKGSYFIATRAG